MRQGHATDAAGTSDGCSGDIWRMLWGQATEPLGIIDGCTCDGDKRLDRKGRMQWGHWQATKAAETSGRCCREKRRILQRHATDAEGTSEGPRGDKQRMRMRRWQATDDGCWPSCSGDMQRMRWWQAADTAGTSNQCCWAAARESSDRGRLKGGKGRATEADAVGTSDGQWRVWPTD